MHEKNGFEWLDSITEVDREQWGRLSAQYETPLLEWDWLRILEESGSVTPDEGWIPQHLVLYRDGVLIAGAPLYVKTHSVGEFVFDYAWAEVAQQLRSSYYPKLVAMSPLTPAIGYRFLVDREEDQAATVASMIDTINRFSIANNLNGFSILWPEPDFAELINEEEFTPWRHQHFRWNNDSFESFDDYLGKFNKNQRRNVRRECASMADQGLEVRTSFAADVSNAHFEAMYDYYANTNDQFGMWAARYLTEDFFHMIKESVGDRVVFSSAYESFVDRPVGMAMLLYKPNRLIGRYWGAARFVNNLHFNLCYYEPIRWGISQGVQRFDPGMGSSHKVRRGFNAVATHSLHHFYNEQMQMVMKMNIDKINRYEQMHIDELNSHVPFAGKRPAENPG